MATSKKTKKQVVVSESIDNTTEINEVIQENKDPLINNKAIGLDSNNFFVLENSSEINLLEFDLDYVVVNSISTWTKAISEFKLIKKHLSTNGVIVYLKHDNNELNKFINYIKNNRHNAVEFKNDFYIVQ
jgi:hypothetical protein